MRPIARHEKTIMLGVAALALIALFGAEMFSTPDRGAPLSETQAAVEEMSSSFVGLREGELVLASTETGEVLRVIADRSVVGTDDPGDADPGLAVRPALTPDRSTVYFSTFRPGVEGRRLVRVPLEGGDPEVLGWGADPAVSLDGDHLAYRGCTENGCGEALVILDLGSGRETRVEPGDGAMQVGEAVWLPDGRLSVAVWTPMDSPDQIHVIDPARPPTDLLAAPSVPDPAPHSARWGLYGHHAPTGGLVLGEEAPRGARSRMVSVDPDTGEVLATVARGGWWQVHPDRSGRHLLLVDFRDRVCVARPGGRPQLIARGFSDVAW
ncbi:MAG: TolB family protein [Actinomycetota bacterium]